MANVQPYLIFNGNCEEAVKFYCDVFGGESQFSHKYKESPVDVTADWKEKIMHTNFSISGDQLMASDCFPGQEPVKGNNIHLSVNFDKKADMTIPFNKLATGGKITMPIQKTFWGANFGQLVDRYGNSWMFNQELEKSN